MYKVDEYIPDFLFEHFDNFRETLVDWLIKFGIIGKVGKVPSGGNDAPRESNHPDLSTSRPGDPNAPR